MCGRYVRRGDKQKIAGYFHASPQPAPLPLPGEDYNVAPTTFQPIIRQSRESGKRELVLARWSLVPFFTKELSDIKGLSTINARAESITKAPTWREPMKKRRCIVPVDASHSQRPLCSLIRQGFYRSFIGEDKRVAAFTGFDDHPVSNLAPQHSFEKAVSSAL